MEKIIVKTVGELVAVLQKLDQEKEILVEDWQEGYLDPTSVAVYEESERVIVTSSDEW